LALRCGGISGIINPVPQIFLGEVCVSHALLGRQSQPDRTHSAPTYWLQERLRGPPSVSLLPHIGGIKRMPTKNGPGDRPRRAIPWSQVRFALGSPLEGSGFEPTVPLRDSAIRAGGAQTDVGRQNGRFSTAGPAVRIRLSGESGANLNSAS
jgi:hypothetical protein